MSWDNFTSDLICSWCEMPYSSRNTRSSQRALCPACQQNERTILKYAGTRSFSKVPREQKLRSFQDKTLRYGKKK